MKKEIQDKALLLIRGMPGSGKSHLAALLSEDGQYPHVEADFFFTDKITGEYQFDFTKLSEAHNWCQNSVIKYMKLEKDKIFVSNTFSSEWELEPYRNLADNYGYKVISIIVENRHFESNLHKVPDEIKVRMRQNFQNSIQL